MTYRIWLDLEKDAEPEEMNKRNYDPDPLESQLLGVFETKENAVGAYSGILDAGILLGECRKHLTGAYLKNLRDRIDTFLSPPGDGYV